MRVYHYLPARWGFEDVEQRRLKIATFDDLNDPFELMCYECPTGEHRSGFLASKDEIGRRLGVLCFSREWDNPVLWSHYGDRHRGLCLGFDVPDPPGGSTTEVIYTAERLPLEPLSHEFALRLLSTKYSGWSYEKEVRVFLNLEHRDPRSKCYYADFRAELALREIITGPLCPNRARIRNAAKSLLDDVRIVRTRLADRSFQVVEDNEAERAA